MKRVLTIFLLLVYIYDMGGYLGLRQYLVYRSDNFFNAQVEKGLYFTNDLTEVKIPMNTSGIKEWADFADITGQVQFPHSCYNYVKMKVTKDTLHLLCLPNCKTTRLISHNIIWAININDIPVPKKDHVPNLATLFMSGFKHNFSISYIKFPVTYLHTFFFTYQQPLINRHIDIPKQPPKQIC